MIKRLRPILIGAFGFALLSILLLPSGALSQDSQCNEAKTKWEQLNTELHSKLQDFGSIQQTSVERLNQKPVLDRSDSRTIARQVSDSLQIKEEKLDSLRKECRNLMNLENQAFNEMLECGHNGKGSKDKELKNLAKKRQSFLDKSVLLLAEVKEVEGKDTVSYSDANNQDPYRRSVNNQWQNYQQMYRRFWGQ